MDYQTQQKILKKLGSLFPDIPDSGIKKNEESYYYDCLQNYFACRSITENLESISKEKRGLSLAQLNVFMGIYNLLFFGWEDIKKDYSEIKMPYDEPDEAFYEILKDLAECQLEICLIPIGERALLDTLRLKPRAKSNPSDEETFKKYKKSGEQAFKKLQEFFPRCTEPAFFLVIIKDICSQSESATVKLAWKEYDRSWLLFEAEYAKLLEWGKRHKTNAINPLQKNGAFSLKGSTR